MIWVALRETLFILEVLRKLLLHNRTNPRQDWIKVPVNACDFRRIFLHLVYEQTM